MAQDLSNKYFVKRDMGDGWSDVTQLFDGVKILNVSGFNDVGESVNVFTQQWVDSQDEDYYLSGDEVIRKNNDLEVTFIAGTKYSENGDVDTQSAFDSFVEYICLHGDFYIKSAYSNKYAHVVCLNGVKQTTVKLHRGENSYILATATLHCIGKQENA